MRYRTIVRLSGIYDASLMLLFLLPGVVALTLEQLGGLHRALGLPGAWQVLPEFGHFFVNMMAVITTGWAVARILDPEPAYGLYDGVIRLALAALMTFYVVNGLTAILLGFVITEVAWGSVQLLGYRSARSQAH